jgi:hypothetical protein
MGIKHISKEPSSVVIKGGSLLLIEQQHTKEQELHH